MVGFKRMKKLVSYGATSSISIAGTNAILGSIPGGDKVSGGMNMMGNMNNAFLTAGMAGETLRMTKSMMNVKKNKRR